MATWRAECWLGSNAGRQTLEVEAETSNGAIEQLKRVYGAENISNVRKVSTASGNSSSLADIGGTGALIGLALCAWAFVSFTPWILMLLGGSVGTWIGEKVTSQSVEEYTDNENGDNKKAAIVLILALLLGGFGFVKGDEIKKGFDVPSAPTQIQKTVK